MLSSLTFCVAALAHAAAVYGANALSISQKIDIALLYIPNAEQIVDSLRVSLRNSGEVSNTTGMFAYFATKLYCNTYCFSPTFFPKHDILITIASMDPQALLGSRISDKVSAFEELFKCKNTIRPIFNFNSSMLEKADPNALVLLPKLTFKLLSEYGFYDLELLANIKLTDSQREQFVGPLLDKSFTPFITPALLVELIVSNHFAMNRFIDAAAQDTIDIAAQALRHKTLESLKDFSDVVPTMDRDSFSKLAKQYRYNRSVYSSVFEVYGQYLANSYDQCTASHFAFFNSLGWDGIMTVYDRALLHLLRNPVQDRLLLFKLFNHQLSLSMETKVRQSNSMENVLMRDLIYSAIYDPNNVGTKSLPFREIFSETDMNTFNVKYIVGFTQFLQFTSVFTVDDGKPFAFVSEADCVGRQTAYAKEHVDLDRYAFPCYCITNQSADAGTVLNTYTLLGQTHCLSTLLTLNSSLENDASLSVDSALLAFINNMPLNYNNYYNLGRDLTITLNWAQRVHSDLSKIVQYERNFSSFEQKLKAQLDCFKFTKNHSNNYDVAILCQNIAPLARSMVDPCQRQVYGIKSSEEVFLTDLEDQRTRREAMREEIFAYNDAAKAIPDPCLGSNF